VSVHAKVTTGTTIPDSQKAIQLVLAATPFSVTTADAPSQLTPSYILTIKPNRSANGVLYYKSEPIVAEGPNFYAWINSGSLGADITLDAEVVEIA